MTAFRTSLAAALLAATFLAGLPVHARQEAPDGAEPATAAAVAAGAAAEEGEQPPGLAQLLADAEPIGSGMVEAYAAGGRTLIVLPPQAFERPFLWYAEAVRLPTEAVSGDGIAAGMMLVRFERLPDRVVVRDQTAGQGKRGTSRGLPLGDAQLDPIDMAVGAATLGPVVAALPVLAADEDGRVALDVTDLFAGDIDGASARPYVAALDLMPMDPDPGRSWLAGLRVFPDNLAVRSHLTFPTLTAEGTAGPPVSIEIGHSIVLLPEVPMQPRAFDPRVGFFEVEFIAYETPEGRVEAHDSVILRHRLEKADPKAAVSEPVKPIRFYLDPAMPARWRPYVKAGVEMWQPAFEAAGFRNAIQAVDAPGPEEDPDWSAEDARYNVIRWLAQPFPNAMGPTIVDPRTGEILSSHVLVWPQVLNLFARYYYGLAAANDPEARRLPLPEAKLGELLTYIVAHEVGHALGLRHNHLASTAYGVAQLRDPEFANRQGPNASIMAYGRFNQAAQPGDGVTRLMPGLGRYDHFAIDWGYGVHGDTPEAERVALDRLAAEALQDRDLAWAAAEAPEEVAAWFGDPRVQRENVGAERVEATRLGIAQLQAALAMLDEATGGDSEEFAATYEALLDQQRTFLMSVADLVGGLIRAPHGPGGPAHEPVPAAEQREAVRFLLGEGAQSLEPFKAPELLARTGQVAGPAEVEAAQAALVAALLDGPRLMLLAGQERLAPDAYGVRALAEDVAEAVWGDLSAAPGWRRALQRAWIARLEEVLQAEAAGLAADPEGVGVLQEIGFDPQTARLLAATGAATVLPAWARLELPALQARLARAAAAAADPDDRLHFETMRLRLARLQS